MTKLTDKQIRIPYPRDGDTDIFNRDAEFDRDPNDSRKFIVQTIERDLSIWESQLDEMVMLFRREKGNIVSVLWEQEENGKTVHATSPVDD